MLIEYADTDYNSTQYKRGEGPTKGERRYKSDKELITPPRGHFLGGSGDNWIRLYFFFRAIGTHLAGLSVIVTVATCYGLGVHLVRDGNQRFAFGLYGAFLLAHMIVQAFFAFREHRNAHNNAPPESHDTEAPSTVAIQISAFQEDPDYLRECLTAITKLKYPRSKLKVILCIDGNDDNSTYMVDIFESVMTSAGLDPVFFRWDYNYHELPDDVDCSQNGVELLERMVADNQCICVMQAWGGKREVM